MQSKIIQRIEEKRQELGMTIKQLSKKSGVPESTYCNIISGKSQNPSYDRLRILAVSVDLSPVEFMDTIGEIKEHAESESLQKEAGKIATGYDLDYLADTFVRVNDQFAADFRTATVSRNEEFQRALRSKDEQFEHERQSYLIASAAKDAHIEHTKDQLRRYAAQFRRYNIGGFLLIGLCAVMLGIMLMMFVNNRSLHGQIKDLQEHIMVCPGETSDIIH